MVLSIGLQWNTYFQFNIQNPKFNIHIETSINDIIYKTPFISRSLHKNWTTMMKPFRTRSVTSQKKLIMENMKRNVSVKKSHSYLPRNDSYVWFFTGGFLSVPIVLLFWCFQMLLDEQTFYVIQNFSAPRQRWKNLAKSKVFEQMCCVVDFSYLSYEATTTSPVRGKRFPRAVRPIWMSKLFRRRLINSMFLKSFGEKMRMAILLSPYFLFRSVLWVLTAVPYHWKINVVFTQWIL